jgi:catechol 2,3-dioxygenase-like lactoylglutathione lyase family enzyme
MNRVLDHVGVAIRDLNAGFDVFSRLGFRLTPRSLHSGSSTPGAPVEPWGSGNHCAMFREGYLEIIGLTDPALYSSVRNMVDRYEGLHIVAIGCDDVEALRRAMQSAGVPVEDAVRGLERDAAFGPEGRETRRARFRNLYIDRQRFNEARFLYIQHLTRDVLWQPHLLDHPNGAVGIDAAFFVTDDPSATAAKFAPAFSDRVERLGDASRLILDRGELWLVAPAQWRARTPGGFVPPAPSPAGFGIRVASLDDTRAFLQAQGVTVHAGGIGDGSEGLWVAPEDAAGAALLFRQH